MQCTTALTHNDSFLPFSGERPWLLLKASYLLCNLGHYELICQRLLVHVETFGSSFPADAPYPDACNKDVSKF